MGFLSENCRFRVLTRELISKCKPFSCGVEDLDNFFREDAPLYADELLGKSYCYVLKDDPTVIVCAYTISNSSVRTDYLPNYSKRMLNRRIPYDKQMRRYPAVLIGRLGVNNKFHGHVIGTELMEYLKARFTDEQYETACRYLAVDAYNNPQTLNFYENKCNFTFLFKSEELESEKSGYPLPLHTRFMFYDLIHVKEQK